MATGLSFNGLYVLMEKLEITKTEVFIYLQFNLWIFFSQILKILRSRIPASYILLKIFLRTWSIVLVPHKVGKRWVSVSSSYILWKLISTWMELKWTVNILTYSGSIFYTILRFQQTDFHSLASCLSRIKVGVFKDRLFYIFSGFFSRSHFY